MALRKASGRCLLACVGGELLAVAAVLTFVVTRNPLPQRADSPLRSLPGSRMSRIVHHSWKTPRLTPRFERWRGSWRRCFPAWRHLLWTDEMNEALVRRAAPWFLDTYARGLRRHPICRADAARYIYMHQFGGIYTDLDNVCLRAFESRLAGCSVLVGRMRTLRGSADSFGYYENSFLYSAAPGHPLWLRLLRDVQANVAAAALAEANDADFASLPEEICGPMALTRALRIAAADPAAGICLAPAREFNPFSWVADNVTAGPCRDLNRMTDAEEALCQRKHRDSYVLQFHTQVWKAGRLL